MFFSKLVFKRTFSIIFAAFCCGTLLACLDVPSDYERGLFLESANILLIKENGDTLKTMQVPANENFKLFIKTEPQELASELNITWYVGKTEISKKPVYAYKAGNEIPDSVSINDNAGNYIGKAIHVTQNTPPVFEKLISPENGDTLKSYANAPILFKWEASDIDNDALTYILEVDGKGYATGRSSSVYQGGFTFGKHTLRIIVQDNFNNADTSSATSFYIKDKEEQ